MTKGTYKYIPKEFVEELANFKIKFNILKDSDAMRKLIEDAKIGREVRFTIELNQRRRK